MKLELLFVSCLLCATLNAQQNWIKSESNPKASVLGTTPYNTDIDGAGNDAFGHGIIVDGEYRLYIGGANEMGQHIGMVKTDDLSLETGWEWSMEPMLSPGEEGGFDELGVGNAYVMFDEGIYKMWFTALSTEGRSVGYATSDDGLSWTKYESGAVFGSSDIAWGISPHGVTVIKDEEGYKMWYVAFHGDSYVHHSIGYATSDDGIHWEDYTENPVVTYDVTVPWRADHHDLPVVIKEDGVYHMWLTGGSAPDMFSAQPQIGYTYSADGVNWVSHTLENPVVVLGESGEWDSQAIGLADVIKIGEEYKLMYGGSDFATTYALGLATLSESISMAGQEHNVVTDESIVAYVDKGSSVNLVFQSAINKPVSITIFDSVGRNLMTKTLNSAASGEVQQFDMNRSNGICFVEVISDEIKITKKVFIQ